MQHYYQSKMRLFNELSNKDTAFIICDRLIEEFLKEVKALNKVYSYGSKKVDGNHLQIKNEQAYTEKKDFIFFNEESKQTKTTCNAKLLGRPAEENLAAALLASALHHQQLCRHDDHDVKKGLITTTEKLKSLCTIPGRMEIVNNNKSDKPTVVVDYAHTPDALEKSLQQIHQTKLANSKVWVVFGCGGDRDHGKRPLMGYVAMQHADFIIITNDNPRLEKPEVIAGQIINGISKHPFVHVELDRGKAIQIAIQKAQTGDFVLIAGKGHEDYQLIGEQKHSFDDKKIARKYLS
jgi:UDP-N-acetylmuramoyl-L-alanyl-D-glutamate--2,6-diaminopimelate ligase